MMCLNCFVYKWTCLLWLPRKWFCTYVGWTGTSTWCLSSSVRAPQSSVALYSHQNANCSTKLNRRRDSKLQSHSNRQRVRTVKLHWQDECLKNNNFPREPDTKKSNNARILMFETSKKKIEQVAPIVIKRATPWWIRWFYSIFGDRIKMATTSIAPDGINTSDAVVCGFSSLLSFL